MPQVLSAKVEDVDAAINADADAAAAANVEETNSAAAVAAPYDPPQPTVINSNGGPPSSSSSMAPTTQVAASNSTPVGGVGSVVSPNSVGVVVVDAPSVVSSPPEALAAS